jgi:hypothetical protein
MTLRLALSFEEKPLGDLAATAKAVDLIVTELERAWRRLEATREALALGDLVMAEIQDLIAAKYRQDDYAERVRMALARIEALAWPAQQWRRLRAAVDQRLRETRLPGESAS